jgi:uncharacterized protein (TIGR03435 family)
MVVAVLVCCQIGSFGQGVPSTPIASTDDAATLVAQQSAPKFEVASVKRNVSGSTRSTIQPPPTGDGTATFVNVKLFILIRQAYQREGFTLISGPFAKLMDVERFDVQTKPPGNAQPEERRAMLRALLEDRFKLRAHKEVRQMPVYAVTVARRGRLGPNLKPSKFDCEAFFTQRRAGGAAPEPVDSAGNSWCQLGAGSSDPVEFRRAGRLTRLTGLAESFLRDRLVVDDTGLSGNFEWDVTFSPRASAQGDYPEIFTAFREQLGLKIVPRQAPIEVLVIDSVQLPTEN